MKNIYILSVLLFVILLSGCTSNKVIVVEMESFAKELPETKKTFNKPTIINDFTTAMTEAHKRDGIADVADPDYKIKVGADSFFLWLSEDSGMIMFTNDRETRYMLSDESTAKLNAIFN
ncbi:hypothetical protein ACIQXI_10405 [Lysinibacillus sp. NPDC097195]|uniref:hypothetical protein n=1 Tax=Lysinibacillus sp. NPDC097195 TaxID=3364141 RepID=UPI00380868A8